MVKIRLKRMGMKKKPFYRVVVADERATRDGRFVDEIGYYNPVSNPVELKIDVEKAQENIQFDEAEAADLTRKVKNADLTLEDFLTQMQQIKKMGPLSGILKMLPGMSNIGDIDIPDDAMKKPEAIIRSMTPKERRNPGILNASRRRRIAAGSGTTVQDVNQLIRQFEESKKQMKMMMNQMRGRKGRFRFPR